MANGDDAFIHWFHTLWSAGITVLGGIFAGMVKWNWDKLNTELDRKADKEEMADSFQILRDDVESWKQSQEHQHTENRQRLDQILMHLGKLRR